MKLKKKTLGTYPHFSVIFSITMALFVIGLFSVLLLFADTLTDLVKEKIEVHVYLQQQITPEQKNEILKSFYFKEYLAVKNDKKQVFFISKDAAEKKFVQETGEDFKQFLGENPLRDAFVLRIDADHSSKQELISIKTQLLSISGVYEVVYVESLINAINSNIQKISIILVSFAIILIFSVFLLINSTIKLALFSQRFLIRSMQLVGAKPWFILSPFLWRSFLQGLLSGLLATGIILGLMLYANAHIPELMLLQNPNDLLQIASILIVLGALIGVLSSYFSIRKYLKMSLDELY